MRKGLGIAMVLFFYAGVTRIVAQDMPKFEVSGGYSYVRGNQITSSGCCFGMSGGLGSVAFNLGRSVGIVGEFGGYHSGNVNNTGLDLNVFTYVFGPRVSYRGGGHLVPFGEVLIGGGHASGGLYSGTSTSASYGSQNGFALTTGGGLDVKLATYLALRLIQADYLLTRFKNGTNDHQNNLRLSAGIVLRFGRK